jgi:hypothetical protein
VSFQTVISLYEYRWLLTNLGLKDEVQQTSACSLKVPTPCGDMRRT